MTLKYPKWPLTVQSRESFPHSAAAAHQELRKQKLSVLLRPGLGSPRISLLLHSVCKRSHKANPDSRGRETDST